MRLKLFNYLFNELERINNLNIIKEKASLYGVLYMQVLMRGFGSGVSHELSSSEEEELAAYKKIQSILFEEYNSKDK